MRKKIIIFTIILSCIPLLIMTVGIFDYCNYKDKSSERLVKIDEDIKNIDDIILSEEKTLEQVKKIENEKIGILNLWKRRLEKIK